MLDGVKALTVYIFTVPVFFIIDMLWLGQIAKTFYRSQIGGLLAEKPNWTAALMFYLIYIAGIVYFAVIPGVDKNSVIKTLLNAIIFGGLAYATYDLTNLATLKNWPLKVSILDICWGIILTSTVAVISFYIAQWIN